MNARAKITCPTCGKANTWHEDNAFRPFCSDRCKLIDLGEWANESRKIPGNPAETDNDSWNSESENASSE